MFEGSEVTCTDRRITIYADRRWPANTSIGAVQARYETRLPCHMRVVDLKVRGRIGSPFSPLRITRSLIQARGGDRSIFFSAGFMPPLWSPVPVVVVVHDLAHLHTYGRSKKLYYDLVLRPLFRRCAAIVCVSDYTRSELLAWTGMDPKRVHVVTNGSPTTLCGDGPRHAPGYPYIFHCGHHRAHKNLRRMVEAFCRSNLPQLGIHFILTNGPNPELIDIAKVHGLADKLVFAGFLSEEELHAYFRGAQALVFASTFEGFGLPILEGFAAGIPVLTSTVTSMPEVAADAALLVDPYCIDAIAVGMERLVADEKLRKNLIARGKARLKHFDWDRSADRIWEIVESVVK